MPLTGEYEPSRDDRTRKQVELYEATNGAEGGTLNGKPVIVLTFKAAKSGRIRKKPLMRIKHDGTYAVVASYAGAPKHPLWYRDNVLAYMDVAWLIGMLCVLMIPLVLMLKQNNPKAKVASAE